MGLCMGGFAVTTKEDYAKIDSGQVSNTDDGGAVITLDDGQGAGETEFYDNLALSMPENELSIIGRTLHELIGRDKEARAKRDEQYEEGIRRTGLGEDAPGGATFMGASKVVHPMLTEACVDFCARVMKEIFPANGPAKSFIPGDPTEKDIERGDRLADFLNYQCTVQISEMRAELEQMVTQLPLGGGQYIKLTWNAKKRRPQVMFVPIDDVYLPFAATNFYSAARKTHVQYLTLMEYESRVRTKMYRDVDNIVDPQEPEMSKAAGASHKVEGKEPTAFNEDGLRTVYECFCLWEIESDRRAAPKGKRRHSTARHGAVPYIVSIDKTSAKVLSIYRNWEEEDELQEEMDWLVEFPFVPWRGAYPIGLVHMIGGLSGAATGALRALLDSAHINNFPGLLKLKGGAGGQTERIEPTQVMEVEGSIQDDDVRKLIMPMPFNPPSPVLFELLGFLVDAGKSLLRTTMEEMADTTADVPVGTTLARLEQGMAVFSAIHARMHNAMGKLLKVLYRINKQYIEEKEIFDDTGKLLAKRQDFEGPMTVVPVSDPNIFSESQRFAQIQLVAQRAQMLPQLYNLRRVEEMILERMKIPNVEEVLLPKQEVGEMNAINENIAASMQRPIGAYPDQDHMAHIEAHIDFLQNPVLGQNPLIAQVALPVLLPHIKEHMVLCYATQIVDLASESAGVDVSELQKKSTTEEKRLFDQMLALSSKNVMPEVAPKFEKILPILQKAQELMQKLAPPQQDPTLELGMAQIQMQREGNELKAKSESEKAAMQAQIEQMKAGHQKEIEQLKAQLKMQELTLKGQTETQKMGSTEKIEGAKLTEQSRQADQVIEMESMKQEQENIRTQAKLQTELIIAEKKFEQDAQLKAMEGQQKRELQQDAHGQQLEQKQMDIASAHSLEDKKQQSAHALEDKKQLGTLRLEDKKAASAKEMEGMKQGGQIALEDRKAQSAMEMEGLKQASTHVLEGEKRKHESKMADKQALHESYRQGGEIASKEKIEGAKLLHASVEGDKERKHAQTLEKEKTKQSMALEDKKAQTAKSLEKDKAKSAEKLQEKKTEGDMKKTRLQEQTKKTVAKDQLQVKKAESKEKMAIAKEESKEKMALKKVESEMMMGYKEKEAQINLKSKEVKGKLDEKFTQESHKAKLDMLKTRTKLMGENMKKQHELRMKMSAQKMKETGKSIGRPKKK